jgi:exopolysaccharide biosynthesis polyprenyl glycosylphosphotransferase
MCLPGTAGTGLLHPVRAMEMAMQPFPAYGVHFPAFSVLGFCPILLATLYIFDLYELQIISQPATLLLRLFGAGGLLLAMTYLFSMMSFAHSMQGGLLSSVAMAVTVAFAWRRFFSSSYSFAAGFELMQFPESRYRFEGFVHTGKVAGDGSGVLGSLAELEDVVARHRIRHLVLATDSVPFAAEPALSNLKFRGIGVQNSPDIAGIGVQSSPDIAMELSQSLPVELLNHTWLRLAEKSHLIERHPMRKLKRLADVVLSIVGIFFFLPVLIICAIAVKLGTPGPVIFRQQRVGWRGKNFTIYKLRTMQHGSEQRPQWAEVNDARITRVGRFLRLTHIDELPQLWNVLKGEMSFVGPRPERPEFVEQLEEQIPFYDVRHSMLPGITGWAQVNFRYGASVADARRKLELDLYYVMHASLILDLLILLKTVQVVLFLRGSR